MLGELAEPGAILRVVAAIEGVVGRRIAPGPLEDATATAECRPSRSKARGPYRPRMGTEKLKISST